jgi:hypothetical protein
MATYSEVTKRELSSDPASIDGTPETFICNQVYPLLYPDGSAPRAKGNSRKALQRFFDTRATYTDPFTSCQGPQNIIAHFDFLLFFFRIRDVRIKQVTSKDDVVMIDSELHVQLKWYIAFVFSIWGVIWWLLGYAPRTTYR